MKKYFVSLIAIIGMILLSFPTVAADNGGGTISVTFIIFVAVLLPILIGVVAYYSWRIKKAKTDKKDKTKLSVKRDYDSK